MSEARPLEWQLATVRSIHPETSEVKTFTLSLPYWSAHRPGQHCDIRLTAPDGYQAQRSYSIASEPGRTGEIDLTVERLEDGEVSTYLHDVVIPGDQIEVRGPIGGYFVWEPEIGGPLLLVAGGSGIVPLMAMLRHRAVTGSHILARLLYSARTREDIIYAGELDRLRQQGDGGLEVYYTLTRAQPPDWKGYSRRIDRAMLQEVATPLGGVPHVYVCGPTLFVESVANQLVSLGVEPAAIKTERFGPTGTLSNGE